MHAGDPKQYGPLTRIYKLIKDCRYSLHDLSRIECVPTQKNKKGIKNKNQVLPRFNMPFEAGLAIALAKTMKNRRHTWQLLEAKKYRLQITLSDLNGYEPRTHKNTIKGVFNALGDTFLREEGTTVTEMLKIYRGLVLFARKIKDETQRDDLYKREPFVKMVTFADGLAARLRSNPRQKLTRGTIRRLA